jgi:PadR family transcriptional regulator PadR
MDELDRKFQKELAAGISALILLKVLSRASGPMYGYQIAKLIEYEREEIPLLKQGTLYPVLRSLEDNKLLQSNVEPSVSGPPRRYYSITGFGRTALQRWEEMWASTREFVDNVLKGESNV